MYICQRSPHSISKISIYYVSIITLARFLNMVIIIIRYVKVDFPCHIDGGVTCTHFLEHILTVCIRHPNLCIPSDKRVSLLEIYPEELNICVLRGLPTLE